jgi:hypothetical protein
MAEMKNENNAPLFVGQPSRKPGSCFFEQNTIFLIDMYSTYSLLTSLILFFLKKKIEQRVREEGYSGVGMRDAMDRRALFFGRQMIFVRGWSLRQSSAPIILGLTRKWPEELGPSFFSEVY